MPVFNDWAACGKVLESLDAVFQESGLTCTVLLIDDGSTITPDDSLVLPPLRALQTVDVLALRRNLGHQRAISIGLAHAEAHSSADTVVLMDSDGEDSPSDVVRLLARYRVEHAKLIIFAERSKRSESFIFKVFYRLYRVVHRILTGRGVRVGNFSVIPRCRLRSLVVVPELWNHYAAAVFVSRQPFSTVPTHRASRLAGKSTMNFVSLAMHGLSAISVFCDVVSVRLLLTTFFGIIWTVVAIGAVVGLRLFTDLAVPGWATYTAGLLLIILLQTVMFAFVFTFITLNNRSSTSVIPARDFPIFVSHLYRVSRDVEGHVHPINSRTA